MWNIKALALSVQKLVARLKLSDRFTEWQKDGMTEWQTAVNIDSYSILKKTPSLSSKSLSESMIKLHFYHGKYPLKAVGGWEKHWENQAEIV